MRHILLDSSPLGLITSPSQTTLIAEIRLWVTNSLIAGHRIYVPEVIDYEIRRELLRARKTAGLAKLDLLKTSLRYLPITTDTMLLAADLWAQARQRGHSTGDRRN